MNNRNAHHDLIKVHIIAAFRAVFGKTPTVYVEYGWVGRLTDVHVELDGYCTRTSIPEEELRCHPVQVVINDSVLRSVRSFALHRAERAMEKLYHD